MVNHKNKDNDNDKRRKIIIMIIILIIIILLLLTSCTCASDFWGRIGNIFTNEKNVEINPDSNDEEIILNQDLKFDSNNLTMALDDEALNITYTYENINPDEFTCVTSDANIATCFVKKGYVVVNAKSVGEVDVTLEAKTNGKKYQAKAKVTIEDAQRYIKLSSTKGTINLKKSKSLKVGYNLVGLPDNIEIKLSNKNAKVKIEDGFIVIEGLKTGKTTITLTIDYNGKTYKAVYSLTIIDEVSNNKPIVKDSDNTLKSLSSGDVDINFKSDKQNYYLSVDYNTPKISFEAKTNSSKAHVTYKYNGNIVNDLKDLELQVGNNKLEIEVEAEDGSKRVYEVNINRANEVSSKLSSLEVSVGTLEPSFKEDITDYYVEVGIDVDSIDVYLQPKDDKAHLTYKYKGKIVDSLEDLELELGNNKVEIVVEDEEGNVTTYTVNIEKKKSDNNYLSDLELNVDNFNFDKNTNNYSLDVPYNQEHLEFKATAEHEKSKVKYYYEGKEYDNLSDVELKPGENKLEIVVESESGKTNKYTLDVYRRKRSIELDDTDYVIYLGNENYKIFYNIYEELYGEVSLVTDYSLEDILVSFKEHNIDYEVRDGYILLHVDGSLKDVVEEMTVKYYEDLKKANLEFKDSEYFLDSYLKEYDVNVNEGNGSRKVVLNNNIFKGDVEVERLPNGLRIYSKDNHDIYVDLTSEDINLSEADVSLKYIEGNSSLVVEFDVFDSDINSYKINVRAFAFKEQINDFDIIFNIREKYTIIIDAESNGGYFNEFTKTYEFLVEAGYKLDLSLYKALKVDITGNCLFYELLNYVDDKENVYNLDDIIEVNDNLTLYAVFSEESKYEEVKDNKRLYLTEVDLFHNEEYYQKYNEDKVIYPGANGSYVMFINNNSDNNLTIKGLRLEEDTICVNNKDCLNMGYVIKYAPVNSNQTNYYYGSKDKYQVLNTDTNNIVALEEENRYHTLKDIVFEEPIDIPRGESIEISLLWKWLDNDEVDKYIGNEAYNNNDIYALTVSLDFEATNNYCSIGD